MFTVVELVDNSEGTVFRGGGRKQSWWWHGRRGGGIGPSPNPDYNYYNGMPIQRRGDNGLRLCIWCGRVQDRRGAGGGLGRGGRGRAGQEEFSEEEDGVWEDGKNCLRRRKTGTRSVTALGVIGGA